MQIKARSSNLNDEDEVNGFLRQKRTKFTDWIFASLIYIILVPTLAYNAVWYFNLKSSLIHLSNEEWIGIQGCEDVFNWVNYSLTWVLVCFFKALFLLFCYSVCCSGENDCTMVCVLFKSLTSLIPNLFFIMKIPDYVKNYQTYALNAINIANYDESLRASCDLMASTLFSYYRWEYAYMIFVLGAFCFIPAGAALMCLKEFWKGLNYHRDE